MIQQTTKPAPVVRKKKLRDRGSSDRLDSVLLRLDAFRTRGFLSNFVVGVTSGERRVGVSMITANLAKRAAQMNMGRVLLVDCNLDHPQQSTNLAIKSDAGLLDLICGEAEVRDVVHETSIDRLHFIATGNAPDDNAMPPEAASAVMKSLRAEYDMVLLDLPPIRNSAKSMLFNRFADGVVLVVDAERSRAKNSRAALEILKENEVEVIGTILNRAKRNLPRWLDRWF